MTEQQPVNESEFVRLSVWLKKLGFGRHTWTHTLSQMPGAPTPLRLNSRLVVVRKKDAEDFERLLQAKTAPTRKATL